MKNLKNVFKKAYKKIKKFVLVPGELDEHTPMKTRIDYVKAFQELNHSYEALVTYDDYNDDMETSKALQEQVHIIEEQAGIYNTVKRSLVEDIDLDIPPHDFSEIEFYGENSIRLYDIDSKYIDRLLGTYSANNHDIREKIEKALQKLNITEQVKKVYHSILNAIDDGKLDKNEDIFVVKRQYFTQTRDQAITDFADEWFLSENELHSSAIQYTVGADPIPNIGGLLIVRIMKATKLFTHKLSRLNMLRK